jgi:glutathione synthase/RimK-type ligase-like ATP-grasp enzyme
MLVGIHVHRWGQIGPFSLKYLKILEFNNIPYLILDINDIYFWEKVKSVTHFIFHWGGSPDHHQIAKSIMAVIENDLRIPVFPNIKTTWHHDDKIRQYFILRAHALPIIKSWIFFEKKPALQWISKMAEFPLVFKLKSGAGSKDVMLVLNKSKAKRLIKKMFGGGIYLGKIPGNIKLKIIDFKIIQLFDQILKKLHRLIKGRDINYQWQKEKNYVLFQKFLPNNEYDTRITIIGNRAFAFRRFNRRNDFRSSGSGLIDYEMDNINLQIVKISFKISDLLEFQSMAYDFLLDENNRPGLCEMSYTYQDKAIFNCPGYWDRELNWHDGHYWPQTVQLIDFLGIAELKQPVLNN